MNNYIKFGTCACGKNAVTHPPNELCLDCYLESRNQDTKVKVSMEKVLFDSFIFCLPVIAGLLIAIIAKIGGFL